MVRHSAITRSEFSSDGEIEDGDPVLQRREPEADQEEDRSERPQATWRQMICPPLDERTDGAEHAAGEGYCGSDRKAEQDALAPQHQYACDNGGQADREPPCDGCRNNMPIPI